MRHVSLTCVNHPNLRWSTKEIAVSDGKYNHARSLFYKGEITDPVEFYSDMSGVRCNYTIPECSCSAVCLIVAPEDSQIK